MHIRSYLHSILKTHVLLLEMKKCVLDRWVWREVVKLVLFDRDLENPFNVQTSKKVYFYQFGFTP